MLLLMVWMMLMMLMVVIMLMMMMLMMACVCVGFAVGPPHLHRRRWQSLALDQFLGEYALRRRQLVSLTRKLCVSPLAPSLRRHGGVRLRERQLVSLLAEVDGVGALCASDAASAAWRLAARLAYFLSSQARWVSPRALCSAAVSRQRSLTPRPEQLAEPGAGAGPPSRALAELGARSNSISASSPPPAHKS